MLKQAPFETYHSQSRPWRERTSRSVWSTKKLRFFRGSRHHGFLCSARKVSQKFPLLEELDFSTFLREQFFSPSAIILELAQNQFQFRVFFNDHPLELEYFLITDTVRLRKCLITFHVSLC